MSPSATKKFKNPRAKYNFQGRTCSVAGVGSYVPAKILTNGELEKLVEDLRHCAMPYTCPHGRPTLIEMNFRELEKKFGRSQ